jgi:hypothetical protein
MPEAGKVHPAGFRVWVTWDRAAAVSVDMNLVGINTQAPV